MTQCRNVHPVFGRCEEDAPHPDIRHSNLENGPATWYDSDGYEPSQSDGLCVEHGGTAPLGGTPDTTCPECLRELVGEVSPSPLQAQEPPQETPPAQESESPGSA